MRGKKVSRAARRELDLVIVAARYDPSDGKLRLAQGYERRGPIWGDVRLYDRETLISQIKGGKVVVTGEVGSIEGDFLKKASLSVQSSNAGESLVAEGESSTGDDLGVPLF
jgi:hypothetical protein